MINGWFRPCDDWEPKETEWYRGLKGERDCTIRRRLWRAEAVQTWTENTVPTFSDLVAQRAMALEVALSEES